mmetsp:Transcript_35754/g.70187  ORF Transcript_35754/g.70187 Transcript_35754/m.70187 type:complete len:256 (-) Transcript_35754:1556-2323(-)
MARSILQVVGLQLPPRKTSRRVAEAACFCFSISASFSAFDAPLSMSVLYTTPLAILLTLSASAKVNPCAPSITDVWMKSPFCGPLVTYCVRMILSPGLRFLICRLNSFLFLISAPSMAVIMSPGCRPTMKAALSFATSMMTIPIPCCSDWNVQPSSVCHFSIIALFLIISASASLALSSSTAPFASFWFQFLTSLMAATAVCSCRPIAVVVSPSSWNPTNEFSERLALDAKSSSLEMERAITLPMVPFLTSLRAF